MPDVPTLLLRTFPAPFELRTPRVLLRQWKESDFPEYSAMNADPEVRQYFPGLLSEAEARAEGERIRSGIAQRGWGMWALEIPGRFPFAGFVGLNVPGYEAPWMPAVEIGWRLKREAWHQGFATEGAVASVKFAFEQLQLPEIVAVSVVPNTPSHNVMHKIGMARDASADFDHPRVPPDWPLKQHILHRLSRETWKGRISP